MHLTSESPFILVYIKPYLPNLTCPRDYSQHQSAYSQPKGKGLLCRPLMSIFLKSLWMSIYVECLANDSEWWCWSGLKIRYCKGCNLKPIANFENSDTVLVFWELKLLYYWRKSFKKFKTGKKYPARMFLMRTILQIEMNRDFKKMNSSRWEGDFIPTCVTDPPFRNCLPGTELLQSPFMERV